MTDKQEVRKLELAAQNGRRTKQIYEDPVIVEVLGEMRQTLVSNIETSAWDNVKEREEIHRMLKTLIAFNKQFERRISQGKQAESRLEQLVNKVRSKFA